MFPNESSSDEISTQSSNALVQNLKDTLGDSSALGSSLAANLEQRFPAAALIQHSYSKDEPQVKVAKTEEGVTHQEAEERIVMQTAAAAGPCDPKSEAEVERGTMSSNPSSAVFIASVIFPRSRCGDDGDVASPSLQQGSSDGQGAQQGSNASHLGSSSSNRLQHCAQTSIETTTSPPPTINIKLTGPQGAPLSLSSSRFLNIPKVWWWRQTAAATGPASNAGWGIPRGLGLYGGGESSLNSGTSGWGTPPSANTSNNASGWGQNSSAQNNPNQNQGQWGSGNPRPGNNNNQGPNGQPNPVKGNQSPQQQGQQPQTTSASGGQQGGQGQQAPNSQAPQQNSQQQQQQSGNNGSGQPPQNGSPSWAQAAGGAGGGGPNKGPGQPQGPNGGATPSSKQLEQLNSMREALFSQDGWGGQHVNQDTGWDIPTSPEPSMKDNGGGGSASGGNGGTGTGPVWKPNVNNGTDLWEANLRNGGQPPPTTAKTPWGHTPATNIGGTWGEDDDVGDSSNVWHGVPSNNNQPGPQWGGAPAPVPKKEPEWGGGSNWGDPRDMRGGGMMDPRSNERDMRGMGGMDMRGGGGDMMRPEMMMRGDPRGGPGPDPRMGRMNGEAPMWGGPKGQQQPGPGNQWPGPPPKDMKNSSGWEEPSPPAARRQLPNYDDGTSLWGNGGGQPPQQQQPATWRGNKHDELAGAPVSHWKEIPTPNMGGRGTGGMQCPPGMGQGRMPGSGGMKPEGPLWNHPQRNGSWPDGPPQDGPGGWTDEGPGKMGWNDNNLLESGGSWGGPKPKHPMGQGGWADGGDVDPSSWGHPKPGPKPITKEMVWASKQFRMLSEMGYKKEDVENALRSYNMSLGDALEYLHTMNPNVRGPADGWRRHEDHSPFDNSGGPHPGGPGYGPGRGFNPAQQMPFAAPPGPGVNNAPSLMNSASSNPSLGSINTMSPAIVQKILTQQPPPAAQPSAQQSFQSVPRNPQNQQPQPSATQLRMLVQQIQMAVQAGYLNHQILNQPLAPQTLLLLNQLLQQIKTLQGLLNQQALTQVQPPSKSQSHAVLQISVQITKTKQQITNLQNQIAAQQAIYVKQQQHQQHMAAQGPQGGDFFKPPMSDPISALHGNFGELSLKDPQQASFQTQQSRLNQWKLPSLDKDNDGSINEFDRAPGTTTKSQSHSSPNMNPLLAQGDSTWSSVGRGGGDSGWPDPTAPGDNQSDGKDWPATQAVAAFTDLVPEFEPGKPWKGTQMKSIEDDPSITPGSVVRSPLSLATIKDTEIFNPTNKTSPPASVVASTSDAIPSLSLSSSTWSFNPPSSSSSSAFASLSTNGSNVRGGPTSSSSWGGMPPSSGGGWSSTWLLLRNLTPQIDGSTLKTLCLQHGPLQNFHLYLNQGVALAKYQTREEAAKAQGALNNCVLSNTTIFAESPADSEVHSMLQQWHVTQSQGPPQVSTGWGRSSNSGQSGGGGQPQQLQGPTKPPPDAWGGGGSSGGSSQLWSSPSASSLWGSTALDGGDQHRATPSSLNSFLPGDLLGEGSM